MFKSKNPTIIDPVITPLENNLMLVSGYTKLGIGIECTAVKVDLVKQEITTPYNDVIAIGYFGKTFKELFPAQYNQK